MYQGSTPRMRGIFPVTYILNRCARFNPAYAGNMEHMIFRTEFQQVQPRVCGEYENRVQDAKIISGSTPRMRGIFLLLLPDFYDFRFNPAYAGNIRQYPRNTTFKQVQPRVCGEYDNGRILKCDGTGSTPRMRGIFSTVDSKLSFSRFNPAYAGNIFWIFLPFHIIQVQPRVCGEYIFSI